MFRLTSKKTIFSFCILIFLYFFTSSAHAQYAGPGGLTITPPTNGSEYFQISGHGCAPYEEVVVTIDGNQVATIRTDENGNFTLELLAPKKPGTYRVEARCGARVLNAVLVIPESNKNPLPKTGSENRLLMRGSIGLVGIGGLLFTTARRKSHSMV